MILGSYYLTTVRENEEGAGTVTGAPSEGFSRLPEASISILASRQASSPRGRWTAIWAPSKMCIRDSFDTAREMWHGENAPAYPTKLPKLMGEKGHIIDFSKIELDRDGKRCV